MNKSPCPVSVSRAESQRKGDRVSVSGKESETYVRKSKPQRQSWGPKWRQELSAERHRSNSQEHSDSEAKSDVKSKPKKPESDYRRNVAM